MQIKHILGKRLGVTPIFKRGFVAAFLLVLANGVLGGVSLESTRVVYKEGQRDVSLKLTNTDKTRNALVQLWIDDGDPDADIDQAKIPFLVTPPLAKIDAGKSQTARISFIGDALDPAREHVFWLNVLEIPPKSTEASQLSFAIRSRIKLFYRPKAIAIQDPLVQEKLQWRWRSDLRQPHIEVNNTSQFHWTISSMVLRTDAKEYDIDVVTMLSPNQVAAFAVKELETLPIAALLKITVINDFGGEAKLEYRIDK